MSTYNINRQITATGLTAMSVAATAATAAIYYRSTTMKNNNKPKCTILVFRDQEGLQPNAISLRYDRVELDKLQFLKKSISTELGTDESNLGNDENSRSIRLFVQATKEEIRNDSDWKSALLSRGEDHGLSEIILISTTDGKELSKVAREQQPLSHFTYTRNVRNLPILGQKLVYSGDDELPLRNAYNNLFTTSDGRLEEVKTVLIHRPTNDASGCYERYNIDYIPANEYGVVQTIDPDLLNELTFRQADFPKMWTAPNERALQDYGGQGLFTSSTTDETWETGHGVLPKFFNAFKIKNYYPLILDKTESFIRQMAKLGRDGTIEDANDWLTCMTADAVVKAAMDYDMKNVERIGSNQELHPFIKSFRYCVGHISKGGKDEQEYLKQKQISADMVAMIVDQTRSGEIGGPLSFITGMLDAKSSANGEQVKLADFFGHCINLMVAGHETTAATIGFCLAELARNPVALAKAIAEIETVLGDRSSPTYEDISKLKYIDACFMEALRLNPPVQQLQRECAHDTIVLDLKGQRIQCLLAGMHRDPEQWDQGLYGDPSVFNPDRHLPGAPTRHPNAMAPFGFGVRACVGSQFALLEAKTFLCMALHFFNIETPVGFVPIAHNGHGLSPTCKDLSLNISPRTGGPLSRVDVFDERNLQ